MFLKTSIFKKMLKEAYKGSGIHIGHQHGYYYIETGYWALIVKEEHFPKKEKAAVVELIGDLPQNEFFEARDKEEKQIVLPPEEWISALEAPPHHGLEKTNILIQESRSVYVRLFRDGDDLVPLAQDFCKMIEEPVDKDDDTGFVGPYRVQEYGRMIFWADNTSTVMFAERSWDRDDELWSLKRRLESVV